MIYEHRCYEVATINRREFIERWGKFVMPAKEKLGAKVVGIWETSIGYRNHIICLLAYDDISKVMEVLQKTRQDETYSEFPRNLIISSTVSILSPTEYSPMK